MNHRIDDLVDDYCSSCNQYGCHLITCEHAFDNRKVPVVQTAAAYVLELEAEVEKLKALLTKIAENDDLRWVNDKGPVHEGWQSDELSKLWADVEEAIK